MPGRTSGIHRLSSRDTGLLDLIAVLVGCYDSLIRGAAGRTDLRWWLERKVSLK